MNRTLSWELLSKYRKELFGISTIMILILYGNSMQWAVQMKFVYQIILQGNIGVDIFLFLSGIGLWFSFSKDQNIKEFYRKRVRRLLPSWICIAVPCFFIMDFVVDKHRFGQFIMDVSTLSFWTDERGMWFISFIIICYLCYPFIYKILNGKNAFVKILLICMGTVAINLIMYFYFTDYFVRLEIAVSRCVIFILGCCSAPPCNEKRKLPVTVPICCLIVYVLLRIFIVIFMKNVSVIEFKTTMIRYAYIPAVIAIVFLVPAILEWINSTFIKKVFRWFGEISLEVYLAHAGIQQIYLNIPFGKEHTSALYYYFMIVPVSILFAKFVKIFTNRILY